MKNSKYNSNCHNSISVELIYNSNNISPIEESSQPSTICFLSNASSIENTRNQHEMLLIQEVNELNNFQINNSPSQNNSHKSNKIPNSCFKIFVKGVINNIYQTAKCFGFKG